MAGGFGSCVLSQVPGEFVAAVHGGQRALSGGDGITDVDLRVPSRAGGRGLRLIQAKFGTEENINMAYPQPQ